MNVFRFDLVVKLKRLNSVLANAEVADITSVLIDAGTVVDSFGRVLSHEGILCLCDVPETVASVVPVTTEQMSGVDRVPAASAFKVLHLILIIIIAGQLLELHFRVGSLVGEIHHCRMGIQRRVAGSPSLVKLVNHNLLIYKSFGLELYKV